MEAGLVVVAMADQGKAVDYVAHWIQWLHIGEVSLVCGQVLVWIAIPRKVELSLDSCLHAVAAKGRRSPGDYPLTERG